MTCVTQNGSDDCSEYKLNSATAQSSRCAPFDIVGATKIVATRESSVSRGRRRRGDVGGLQFGRGAHKISYAERRHNTLN